MRSSRLILAVFTIAASCLALSAEAAGPYQFNSLTPCRVFDTRETAAETNAQALTNPGPHYFTVRGKCAVPSTAKAVTVNITIVGPNAAGDLRIFPSDAGQPLVSTLNYNANEPALANGAIAPLSTVTTNRDIAILLGMAVAGGQGRVHVLMDVTGYFQ